MQASVEGFKAFIKEQPAERPLMHRDWYNCAVGEYMYSVENYYDDPKWLISNNPTLCEGDGSHIRDVVGESNYILELQTCHFANVVIADANEDLLAQLSRHDCEFDDWGELVDYLS